MDLEARDLVAPVHGRARIERVLGLQVAAEVPTVLPVHDEILHEDPIMTGILLHGPREAVAILERHEQRVAGDRHDTVSQAVHAVVVLQ